MNVEPTKMATHQGPAQSASEPAAPQFLEEPDKTQLPAVDDVVDVHVVEAGSSGLLTSHGVINNEGSSLQGGSSSSAAGLPVAADEVTKEAVKAEGLLEEDNGRERLKTHRIEMAATRVWIPDIWGQEELLKDWIDCSAFEAALVPSRIMSARAALVEEGRRANSGRIRIENRC